MPDETSLAEGETLTIRDRLALDRTRMANERTLLAYLRTSFMLMIAGATAIRLFGDSLAVVLTGWALILLGLLILGVGSRRFALMRKAINTAAGAETPEERATPA